MRSEREKLRRRYLRLVLLATRHRDQCRPCRESCWAVNRRCRLGVRIDEAKTKALNRCYGIQEAIPS